MPSKKPRTRKITTETFEDEDERTPPQIPFSDGEMDDGSEDQVRSILDSLGPGDVKIKISKWGPKGAAYCFSTDGEIDEDFIQSQFGGGRYTGKIFVNGVYRHQVQLNIADRVSNAASGNGGSIVDVQARMMQQQIDFLKDIVLRGNNQERTPVGELAEAMTKVHELSGGGGGLGEKAVELLLKGIELGKGIGGADKAESWTDIVREALPVVGELMKSRQNPAGAAEQRPQPQQRNSLPEANISDVIRQGIDYLKPKALRNVDPMLYVDLIAASADEPQYAPILHFILTSEFSALAEMDAEISKPPYDKWFRAFYDGLRSAFEESDNVELDTGGAGGNGGNAANNGGAGKTGGGKSGAKKAG